MHQGLGIGDPGPNLIHDYSYSIGLDSLLSAPPKHTIVIIANYEKETRDPITTINDVSCENETVQLPYNAITATIIHRCTVLLLINH